MSNNFYNKLNNIYNSNNKSKYRITKNPLFKNTKGDMDRLMKKSGSLPSIKNKSSN